MTTKEIWPSLDEKLRIQDSFKIMTKSNKGEFIKNHGGNIKFGSAQPCLLTDLIADTVVWHTHVIDLSSILIVKGIFANNTV